MPGFPFAPLSAALALLLLQPAQALAEGACAEAANCPPTNRTNTFTAYQIIGLNPHGVVSPRNNVGLQIVTPGVGPETENTPVDAFSYNGQSNFVAERYDFRDGHFTALGAGESVGGFFGAAFDGHGDPVDAGVAFATTEAQTPDDNGMDLLLTYTPNGSTALRTGLAVSPHGKGGVTIGDETLSGPISDLGNGTLHAADSIATGNHLISTGHAPALSSCGAGPAISGTDAAGVVTTGGAVTACTLSFAKAYASAPVCIVQTKANARPIAFVRSVSAAAMTVAWDSSLDGAFNYICQGAS